MVRFALVAALVFSLSGSQAFAQSFQDSVRREGVRAAAQGQAQAQSNPMPPAYKWTGIGLLAGGGLYMAIGAALSDPCDEITGSSFCVSDADLTKKVAIGFGAALAATGAVLLVVGNSKRGVSPGLLTTPRGLGVGARFAF